MSRHTDFNGFRLLVAQQPLVAIDETGKVLHSILDGFKVKMDSRFRLSTVFVLTTKDYRNG
jgi:hypothetical protein